MEPVADRYPNYAELIETGPDLAALDRLRRAETIGRPLGEEAFVTALEARTQRPLRPAKRGRKARDGAGRPTELF